MSAHLEKMQKEDMLLWWGQKAKESSSQRWNGRSQQCFQDCSETEMRV